VCYIGTLNPGHRHRTATKSTLEFARNLRFCLKRINRQRRKKKAKLSQLINTDNDELYDEIF
jgi:rRNA maturation protein Rpf1